MDNFAVSRSSSDYNSGNVSILTFDHDIKIIREMKKKTQKNVYDETSDGVCVRTAPIAEADI